jgi:hypothetical protein
MSTSYNKNTSRTGSDSVTSKAQGKLKMNQPSQPARNVPSASAAYAGIAEARTDTRYPWFSEAGRYTVVLLGWRLQTNLSGALADVADFEILKTTRGGHQPGDKLTRMRVKDQWNTWLTEVKSRAVTLLTVLNDAPVSPNTVDVAVITAITQGGELAPGARIEGNGKVFFGMPFVVELDAPTGTKGGKQFAAMRYLVPTPHDLEGVNVLAPAAPTPAPVVAAPVAVQAAPAELDDFGTLLSLGWSEAEINGLDDIAFGTAVDGKVVRSTVTLSANGQSFAAAAPARRSRVAPGASA